MSPPASASGRGRSWAGIVATTSGVGESRDRRGCRDVVGDDSGVVAVARGDDKRAGADRDHDRGRHEQLRAPRARPRRTGDGVVETRPYARSCCSRSIDIGDSQAVAQPDQRAVEVVAQRRYRAIENGRRIGIGEVVRVDEQHRRALLRRERGERGR